MVALTLPEEWREQLGYLPVPLLANANDNRFVLLNGSKGNFCLDVSPDTEPVNPAAVAWSSDVDHYVRVVDRKVEVCRWDAPQKPEEYAIEQVAGNLSLFQRYLESRPAPRELSVVAHAISAYRVIRAKVRDGADGYHGLLSFLSVLASAWEDQSGNDTLSLWSESAHARDICRDILSDRDFADVKARLLAGPRFQRSGPNLDLLIRHASGRIFQEAHYLALTPAQGDLFLGTQAVPLAGGPKGLGAYFTPTPLVRTVVEQALARFSLAGRAAITLFDPACGSGEFLREALRQLSIKGYQGQVRVVGFDISDSACAMARFVLAAEATQWQGRITIEIECRDSLVANEWPASDLCLMNPPFISWAGLTKEQQETVAQSLGELHQKRPDMASAFVHLAVQKLAPAGVLGTVLPASLLDGKSAEKLREFVMNEAHVDLVIRLGSQQVFSDAIVDPGIFVASRRPSNTARPPVSTNPTLMLWADHEPTSSETALRTLRRLTSRPDVPLVDDTHFSLYSVDRDKLISDWAPRPYRSAKTLLELSHLPKVASYFSVQQGTITGMNPVFLLSSAEYRSLSKAEQKYFRPAILNESIKAGKVDTSWWVFYPYGDSSLELPDEETLASRVKSFYSKRLFPNKENLLKRARIKPDNWWRLSEHRAWQCRPSIKIVSTYFGAAGSFALDKTGADIVVQGYGWVPKAKVFKDTDKALHVVLAILNSSVTDKLLAGVSNNLAGGQWNLSKRFVEKMPMPHIEALPEEVLDALAHMGAAISAGERWAQQDLNRLAHEAYGLTAV